MSDLNPNTNTLNLPTLYFTILCKVTNFFDSIITPTTMLPRELTFLENYFKIVENSLKTFADKLCVLLPQNEF
jgi:hypothetical protein